MVWHGLAWFGMEGIDIAWYELALFDTFWHFLAWFGMVWHGLAWLILGWHMWYEYMCAISSLNIPKSKPNHTKPYQTKPNQLVWHCLDQEGNFKPVLPLRIFEISAFLSHF